MASLSTWILIISIIIIILAITFGVAWYIRNNNTPIPPPNKYSAPLVWSSPTPGPNPNKNTCQKYQFPTSLLNVNGKITAIPGVPTFNNNILDKLQGNSDYPTCLDTDQIIARQVQHKCTAPNGVVNGAITRCLLMEGGTTGLGGTETYYTNSGCFNVPLCPGELSLISVNYQAPSITNIYCLEKNGINITASPCDPSNSSQLFRVTRINPGQNPNTLLPGKGQNGLIAQILDRDTNLCIIPGNSTINTTYSPSYLSPGINGCIGEVNNCTGPEKSFSGTNLILGACTGGNYPGYIWALIPSIEYCTEPDGCRGCTGCSGCKRIPMTNNCTGCSGCTGHSPQITPPQIVNISNINTNNLPLGPTGYNGITGPSAILKYLIDNNSTSMYYGGTGNNVILTNIGVDNSVCEQKPYTAQYLNLVTYNTLINEEVCLANCLVNCVNL